MKVGILTNGSYGDYCCCDDIATYDFIICADNGLTHAKKLAITPNFIIGDFDSIDKETLEEFKHIETSCWPVSGTNVSYYTKISIMFIRCLPSI